MLSLSWETNNNNELNLFLLCWCTSQNWKKVSSVRHSWGLVTRQIFCMLLVWSKWKQAYQSSTWELNYPIYGKGLTLTARPGPLWTMVCVCVCNWPEDCLMCTSLFENMGEVVPSVKAACSLGLTPQWWRICLVMVLWGNLKAQKSSLIPRPSHSIPLLAVWFCLTILQATGTKARAWERG